MIELLTSMWVYLAGAGVIGLILGWSVRGAFIPRAKTVSVTSMPVVAPSLSAEQAELLDEAGQTREALTASQSRLSEMDRIVANLKSQLEAAQARMADQADQLAAAKAAEPAPMMSAPTAAPAQPSEDAEKTAWMMAYYKARIAFVESAKPADSAPVEPELQIVEVERVETPAEADAKAAAVWKQRYLESRVRFLEGQLVDAKGTPEEASAPVEPEVDVDGLKAEVFSLTDKLRSAESVAARAGSLEEEVTRLSSELDTVKTTSEPEVEAEEEDKDAEPSGEAVSMAKLSWQNRYLKARVNHLENASPASAPVVSTPSSQAVEQIDALREQVRTLKTELSRIGAGNGDAEQELAKLRWRNRYLEGRLKYLEAATLDADIEADDEIIVAEVGPDLETPDTMTDDEPDNVLAFIPPVPETADVEEVRPPSLDAPEGDADDLRKIGGIGPKIEGILNQLGIFHYRQIAAWTKSEEAWIDSYLRFQGRVMREKWIEQAADLASAKDS